MFQVRTPGASRARSSAPNGRRHAAPAASQTELPERHAEQGRLLHAEKGQGVALRHGQELRQRPAPQSPAAQSSRSEGEQLRVAEVDPGEHQARQLPEARERRSSQSGPHVDELRQAAEGEVRDEAGEHLRVAAGATQERRYKVSRFFLAAAKILI